MESQPAEEATPEVATEALEEESAPADDGEEAAA